ncbi:Os02g0716950, partial [Oryza sativa Japonica Group]
RSLNVHGDLVRLLLVAVELDALVPHGARDVHGEVDQRERGEEEVEPVEVAGVEVPGDPPGPPVAGGEAGDHAHQHDAHVVPQRDGRHAQRAPEALHAVGGLPVEELQLPHVHEHLRRPDQRVLRHLPQHAQGARLVRRAHPLQPLHLHHAGDHHGRHADHEPHAHPLQLGQPLRVAGQARHDRHEHAPVDGDERQHAEDVEHRHARRGHVERPDVGVHGGSLLHEQRRHLGEHHRVYDRAQPDGQHLQDALHFLHLGHRAQPPRILHVLRRAVVLLVKRQIDQSALAHRSNKIFT